MSLFGAIEAGGTKFICAIGSGPGNIRANARFSTTTPEQTMMQTIAFFKASDEPLAAIGIGSFGPVDLDPRSPTYGYITSTPKPGWRHTDVGGAIQRALGVPVAFETDVTAAAIGEQRWGAGQGVDSLLYMTIGTGIGGGVLINGRPVHGVMHPEIGHVPLPRDRQADPFAGVCPYHGDCLEGLAAGPAMRARWGKPAEELPPDHPAWALEAHYLALGICTAIYTLSPQRVILGGGVMQQPQLFPLIRAEVLALLNGYIDVAPIRDQIDSYIVPPALGNNAGMLGALALAQDVLAQRT